MPNDIVARDQLRPAILRCNLPRERCGEIRRDQRPPLYLAGVEGDVGGVDAETFCSCCKERPHQNSVVAAELDCQLTLGAGSLDDLGPHGGKMVAKRLSG